MAKMFYSLEEAAEKLGKSNQEMQQLADSGQLQQFRDRDKVMFKVDQVDAMAASQGSASGGSPDDSVIPLAGDTASGDTDAIDLIALDDTSEAPPAPTSPPAENSGSATGISVFDADEVDAADPMAQTVVSEGGIGDDDLTLESVGSGSGLLDLTRESDDTSLGAELLEEIYPGGGESIAGASGAGFSGIFDEVGVDSAPSSAADIEGAPAGELSTMAAVSAEAYDGAASGMAGGFMIGALIALLVAMVILFNELFGGGVVSQLATAFAGNIMMYGGGLLGVALLLGVVGLFVGKAMDK